MKQYAMSKNLGAYIWADINAWIKKALLWRTIKPDEDEIELAEGIKILNFGAGHAYGLIGVDVALPGEGGCILAAGAMYKSERYGPVVKTPGISYECCG